MKTTIEKLFQFRRVAQAIYSKEKERTKFTYALKKVLDKTECHEKSAIDATEDAKVELALTDARGVFERDEKGEFKYTRENLSKLAKKNREILAREIEVEVHLCKEIPEGLSLNVQDALAGFVIEEVREP